MNCTFKALVLILFFFSFPKKNPGQCEVDGTIQLVNGTVESEGRLEVCLSGVWGTVTDDLFDDYTAAVLCNILGYPIGGKITET